MGNSGRVINELNATRGKTGDEIREIPIVFLDPPERIDDKMEEATEPNQKVIEARLPPPTE